MRLVSDNRQLSDLLCRCAKGYRNIDIAVAWASANTSVFEILKAHPARIRKAVIGTHFYQTHPDVLDTFVGSDKVRFILRPSGVFHPKIYLFWDTQDRWEALVGSANLTSAALTCNDEAAIHLSHSDANAMTVKDDISDLVNEYWTFAKVVSADSARSYRAIWRVRQSSLRSLGANYGRSPRTKAPVESKTSSMTWSQFLSRVRAEVEHDLDERCEFLDFVRGSFAAGQGKFRDMDTQMRRTIAGLPTKFNEHWGWFGSM